MTQVSLIANAQNNIDLHLTPVKESEDKEGDSVSESDILALIQKPEYSHFHINIDNIKNAIIKLNETLTSLQKNQHGQTITYQILERIDASISIFITDDAMTATAEIISAKGGKHLSAKAILKAAQANGVKKGFSKTNLVKLAQLAAKAKPLSLVTLPIATGVLAKNGKDAHVIPLVESVQSRILSPKKRPDGSVDMRDLGDIVCVRVGEPIAEKIPLTLGENGYTVTAILLTPVPGNDVAIVLGAGTAISNTNKNILISQKIGLPKIILNGMEVDEVFKVKNVDVASGNIIFSGSVIIEGDINEGMKVIASGDITVGGFVESATVEAGGDITIAGGIIGRKHEIDQTKVTDAQMSVSVTTKGSLYAKYCQYAHIHCSKDIRIETQLLHSLITVDGNLKVGSMEQANGVLVGGSINAKKHVSAGIIGATAGSNTVINFERVLTPLKNKMKDIESRLTLEENKTAELKSASDKLKQLPKSQKNSDILAKVISTYQFHAKKMGEILFEKEAHESKIQEYKESVSIEATEKLHPGVQFILGNFQERTRREYGPSTMIYKARKIHINSLINPSTTF